MAVVCGFQVIGLWFDVQRTWSHLESIFIGSEDIRKQLPVDSERFDDIDTEFKQLMVTMSKTPNVVKVCCHGGANFVLRLKLLFHGHKEGLDDLVGLHTLRHYTIYILPEVFGTISGLIQLQAG